MDEPSEKYIRELLDKTYTKDVPSRTTKDQLECYKQLEALYQHWFRKEL